MSLLEFVLLYACGRSLGIISTKEYEYVYFYIGVNVTTPDQYTAQIPELNQRMQYFKTYVNKYLLRNERRHVTVLKIGIIEFISALFGIAGGLVVTYNDSVTSNYLIMNMSKAVLLFGIGLEAGSLKE